MVNVKFDAFKSIILQGVNSDIRVNEGDTIEFTVEATGEIKSGVVQKVAGSKKERKFQILPSQSACEELWSIFAIAENSLKVTKRVHEFIEDLDDYETSEDTEDEG